MSTQSAATVWHREQGVSAPVPSYVFIHSEGCVAKCCVKQVPQVTWPERTGMPLRTLQRGDIARIDLRQAGA